MKKLFSIFSVILALLISLSAIPGCTSTKGDPQTQNNGSAVAAKKNITLEIWMPLSVNTAKSYSSLDDHKITKELENRYGIDLKFIHPASGQIVEQVNLMIASSTYPDLIKYSFDFYKGGTEAAIKDGVLVNINDYLDKNAPNFKKIITENPDIDKEVRSDNGTILKFGSVIPDKEIKGLPFYGPVIRKDLLEQLNLSMPETIDDWYAVLTAFKNKLNLDVPLVFTSGMGNMYGAFTGAYGVPISDFYQENGNVQYAPIQPGFKEFLTTFSKWHKEGLISMKITKTTDVQKYMAESKSGAFQTHSMNIPSVYNSVGGKKQDFVLAAAPIPALKKGEKTKFRHFNSLVAWDPIYVTTACKNPAEAVQFVDYLYTEEARDLLTWGLEGEGHIIVDRKKKFSDLVNNNPDGLSPIEAKSKYCLQDLTTVFDWEEQNEQYALPEQKEAWKVWGNSATYDGYLPKSLMLTAEEDEKFTEIMSAITPYANQMTQKFIKGEASLVEFEAFVQQIKKLNIDEAVKLQQAALERYKKK